MSDRRTFLENAAAAVVMTKISSLRSFGFATDGPEKIDPRVSDREKAGLRGPVKQYTEETITPGVQGDPEMRFSQTTEYDPDGRILSTSRISTDGSKWVTTQTYDADGRMTKTISGNASEPGTETLYTYDEAERLLSITEGSKGGGSKTEFHYDEQGRKTTTQSFDPETLKRAQGSMYAGSPWDVAVGAGIGVPIGGNITTIYDGNDQPTEAQIRDSEGHIVSRIVRSYDAHGRIIEEKPIQENPAWLFADRFSAEERAQLNDKQLEAMNTAMKSMFSGRSGAGISYTYDAQSRVTKIHDRNFAFDKVTTTSYNEQGDKSEERTTLAGNSTVPVGVAFSVDENGTLIPDKRATEPTELPEWLREQEIRYAYQYDSYGNWTQQTVSLRSTPNETSYDLYRKLTYY
jgi:YD repeat-containing protein